MSESVTEERHMCDTKQVVCKCRQAGSKGNVDDKEQTRVMLKKACDMLQEGS